jgi:predicted extracellular nuclease
MLDFESPGGYSTSPAEFTDNGTDYFTRTDGSNISGESFTNMQGTYYFAAQDTDGDGGPLSGLELTWGPIDISGYSNLQFTGFFAEDDDGSNQDWDADSNVTIEVEIDSGGFSPILCFEASGGTNTEPAEDTNCDGIGDGTKLTDAFTQYAKSIPGVGTNLIVRISINYLDAGDEDIAFDSLAVTGDIASGTSLSIAATDADKDEGDSGNTAFTFTVTRSGDTTGATAVDYAVIGSGANSADATDFGGTLPSGTVNFVATDTSRVIAVNVSGDTDVESDETFTVTLSNATGGAIISTASADGTIQNDDLGNTSSWVINEIHADPDAINGDANGDGTVNTSQDEFVEIVNNTGGDVDISGWKILDGFGLRHTFPSGTVVKDQCAIVVFAGGTPTGSFGNAVVQTASGGQLGLNNDGDTVTLNDGTSDQVVYTYGGEGGDNQSLTRDPDITGVDPMVKHTATSGSSGALFSPGTKIDGSFFDGCQIICGDSATFIHTIQGNGTSSAEIGNNHTIEGIVVGDFQSNTYLSGFFVQEEDADVDADVTTSEGIFVADGDFPATAVNVGDKVRVSGTVAEDADRTETGTGTLTQLNSPSVTVCSSGNSVTAASVTLPETTEGDLERYEGMLISVASPMTVVNNYYLGRYGQMTLSASGRLYQPTHLYDANTQSAEINTHLDLIARTTLVIDDGVAVDRCGDNPNPVPYLGGPPPAVIRAGDAVSNLQGVLGYGQIDSGATGPCYDGSAEFSGDYRLHPTQAPTFTNANTRPAAPTSVGGNVTVATFNVLNFFTTLDVGPNICGPAGGLECRGADSATEYTRQLDKLVAAICTIDADIVGLMEIENPRAANDPLSDGIDNYTVQALVNALNDGGSNCADKTYTQTDATATGSDAIQVAIIYKSSSVTPVGIRATLTAPAFVDPNTTGTDKNRPAVAQTFEENTWGEQFTVIVNHLKSKGSSCGTPDDDPLQGNCNDTRNDGADYLVNTWLATDPTGAGDPDFLIIGDLNAYAKEDPITTITTAGYTDLVNSKLGATAYTFIFAGQSGYLDYALANASLNAQVNEVTVWHINTDEPTVINYDEDFNPVGYYSADAYRASDHDPVIVGLDLYADVSDLGYQTAWHNGQGILRLGTAWSGDTGDSGSNDDTSDDGVTFSGDWLTGQTATVTAQVTGGSGWLSCWFDWDLNNTFIGSERTIDQAVAAGSKAISFTTPTTLFGTGENLEMDGRCRLYSTEPTTRSTATPDGRAIGGEVEDYIIPYPPTVITLTRFDAIMESSGIVRLEWETSAEIDTTGFNVYRSSSDSFDLANAVQVNSALIPAQGSLGQGASYWMTDSNVTPGVWYYFLEDIDTSGVTTQHGPAMVDTSSPTSVALSDFGGGAEIMLSVGLLLLSIIAVLGLLVYRRQQI